MKRTKFSLSGWLWLVVAAFSGLVLTAAMIGAVYAVSARPASALEISGGIRRALLHESASTGNVPGGIEGILRTPGGITLAAGGWVDLHDRQGNFWGAETNENGYYQIPDLPPGIYELQAHPPPDSPFAASLPEEVEYPGTGWIQRDLELTKVSISGYVHACGVPTETIEGAGVVAHTPDWSVERWSGTDINGEFRIGGLITGQVYLVEVELPDGSRYPPIEVVPVAITVVLELCIPPPNIIGSVVDPAGDPVPGAGIVVHRKDFWAETGANEVGDFAFHVPPLGPLEVQAFPPWGPDGAGLLPSPPIPVTVTEIITFWDVGVITLTKANKTVAGYVYVVGTTDPVTAVVVARRLDRPGYADTLVDPTGAYTLYLPAGEWHLFVEPPPPPDPPLPDPPPPPPWIFGGPPAWVAFEGPVSEIEAITDVILEVIPANAHVEGQVVRPSLFGLCPGVSLPALPPFGYENIWIELRNDEIGTGGHPWRVAANAFDFRVPVPEGWYELVVHVEYPYLQGPPPMPVFVGPHQTLVLEEPIVLRPTIARIVGTVQDHTGNGVPGVRVFAWQPEEHGWGEAETQAGGVYTMYVVPGEWSVEPGPGPDMPFVYLHRPRLVQVARCGEMRGIDFNLTRAGSRIQGIAVDQANPAERLWGLDGWASAHIPRPEKEPLFFSDAPLWDGGFDLKVRGGITYVVGLHLPPHSEYVSGGFGPVPVGVGEEVTDVVVPLERKDSVIQGWLINGRTGLTATTPVSRPIWGEVFGWDEEHHWVNVNVDPHTAWYELAVVSGTWRLRTWVDPESGYVGVPTVTMVTAETGSPKNVNFEVWPIGTFISGTVFQPDGTTPMTRSFVFAEGEAPGIGYFETFARTDEDGQYKLLVPQGVYLVGAGLPPEKLEELGLGWLNPPPVEGITTTVDNPRTGLDFQFRALDGVIGGTISFASDPGITLTHPAFVWGWTDDGEWMEVPGNVVSGTKTFTYSMPVIAGKTWHIGAVYDDWDNGYYYESEEVEVVASAAQNLTLGSPEPMLRPLIVSFEGSQMQTIVLPDGVKLVIPAGAIVDSGTVMLFIFPTREVRPEPGQEIIGVGYEIWAVDEDGQEITQFNQNVMLTFYYTEDLLAQHHVLESRLVPIYYSTLVGHWILADSYVVDTVNNEITLNVTHFTKFGFASTSQQYDIYLPVVLRNFQ